MTSGESTAAKEERDRLVVSLELQQTQAEMEIAHLHREQKELQQARDRLHNLYQNIPISYVTLDENGLITDCNRTAANLLGLEFHSMLNPALQNFVLCEDIDIALLHLRRCGRCNGGGLVVSELRLKHTERRSIPVQMVSTCSGTERRREYQTAIVDLTERQKNEGAVREAREFADAIIQTIHEPLLVVDASFRILRMNEAFAELFHAAPKLMTGLSLEAVLKVSWTGNDLRSRLEDVLLKNVPLKNFEFRMQHRASGPQVLLCNVRRLQHKEDSAPVLLIALEDITARKGAEEQVAQTNQLLQHLNEELERRVDARTHELRESNKQLESFCYSIAHDLRGPLRVMAGFGTALQEDPNVRLGDRGADFVRRIVAAGQQMDTLIQDLLEYGRFNTVELLATAVDANEILNRVIANLHVTLQERHAKVVRKGKLPVVLGHDLVLATVFTNLFNNAMKFVAQDVKPEITVWSEDTGSHYRIWIGDNGIGIEPQYYERIFEVFKRLHSQKTYAGTGIGLAIVRRSIQRIGGTVGVESEPGRGSRFWISLQKPPP